MSYQVVTLKNGKQYQVADAVADELKNLQKNLIKNKEEEEEEGNGGGSILEILEKIQQLSEEMKKDRMKKDMEHKAKPEEEEKKKDMEHKAKPEEEEKKKDMEHKAKPEEEEKKKDMEHKKNKGRLAKKYNQQLYRVMSDVQGIIVEGLSKDEANRALDDYWKYEGDPDSGEEAWVEPDTSSKKNMEHKAKEKKKDRKQTNNDMDCLKGQNQALKANIQGRKDRESLIVRERVKVMNEASRVLKVSSDELIDLGVQEIKTKVVNALYKDIKTDGKTKEYIDGVYEVALTEAPKSYTRELTRAVKKNMGGAGYTATDPNIAQKAFEERKNAWKKHNKQAERSYT